MSIYSPNDGVKRTKQDQARFRAVRLAMKGKKVLKSVGFDSEITFVADEQGELTFQIRIKNMSEQDMIDIIDAEESS